MHTCTYLCAHTYIYSFVLIWCIIYFSIIEKVACFIMK